MIADNAFPVDTDIEALFDPASGYWNDIKNWDAADYAWKCRVDLLCEELNIPAAEQPAFRKKYDISKGYMTLEWVLPSPPPAHTFNEQPIIKEYTTEPPAAPSFYWLTQQLLDEVWQSKQVTDDHKKTLDSLCRAFLVPGPVRPYLSELLNFYARRELPKLLDFDPDVHHPHGTDNLTEEEVAAGLAYSHLTAPPDALRVLGIGPMPGNTIPHVGTPYERAQGLGYNGPIPVPEEYPQQRALRSIIEAGQAHHAHDHEHGHGHDHHPAQPEAEKEGFLTRQLRQIYERLERATEQKGK